MLTRRRGITRWEGGGRDSSATLGMTWGISRMEGAGGEVRP